MFIKKESGLTFSEKNPRSAEVLKLDRGLQETYEDALRISEEDLDNHFPIFSKDGTTRLKCVFYNTKRARLNDLLLSTNTPFFIRVFFFFCLAEAEYSYFSADFRLNIFL